MIVIMIQDSARWLYYNDCDRRRCETIMLQGLWQNNVKRVKLQWLAKQAEFSISVNFQRKGLAEIAMTSWFGGVSQSGVSYQVIDSEWAGLILACRQGAGAKFMLDG